MLFFNALILKNKKYLAREDNPLTRITRTVLYIYTKNCIQEGGSKSLQPIAYGTARLVKFLHPRKILHAGGHDADMGIPITGYP